MVEEIKPARVLVVDDDPQIIQALVAMLARIGDRIVVDTAHDFTEALSRVLQTRYALVITGYRMPGAHGLNLVQAVQRVSAKTPVALMTARDSNKLRATVECLELAGFLKKPPDAAQVRALVNRVLGIGPSERRVLIVQDECRRRRLLSMVIREAHYQITEASTLEDAQALLEAGHYDIVLCDVRVGGVLSTELLRDYVARLRNESTHIVVIDGEGQLRYLFDALGIEFYMEKPVALTALLTLMNRLTGNENPERDRARGGSVFS